MLACYCLQGKQLASGVIGLLTCQSHYNVSGINRTPCARLLLRHPLAQHIPTDVCECSVSVSQPSLSLTLPAVSLLFLFAPPAAHLSHIIITITRTCFTPFIYSSFPSLR